MHTVYLGFNECLEVLLNGKPGSLELSFHLQVCTLLWKDEEYCALFEKLPADMHGCKTGCALVQLLSGCLLDECILPCQRCQWIWTVTWHRLILVIFPMKIRSENNRYFGWAIYSMRSKMINAQAEESCMDFLTKMRIYYRHAIQDKKKEYMWHCYSQIDPLWNDGFLNPFSSQALFWCGLVFVENNLALSSTSPILSILESKQWRRHFPKFLRTILSLINSWWPVQTLQTYQGKGTRSFGLS
jgi:hypothetical protein